MPRYIDVQPADLDKLHEGLKLLEMVDRDAVAGLDLFVYGISNNPQIVDAAKEAIADSEELDESDVQLAEVAVAIPLSSDTSYYLNGSGLILRREDFAYLGSGGEGVRTLSFAFSHYHPRVALNAFTKIALASSDAWLDEFLRKEGSNQPAQVTHNVRRDEEATQPQVPVAPPTPQAPAAPATGREGVAQMPKQTSLSIASLLDSFLD
jgi:hypothetical protein